MSVLDGRVLRLSGTGLLVFPLPCAGPEKGPVFFSSRLAMPFATDRVVAPCASARKEKEAMPQLSHMGVSCRDAEAIFLNVDIGTGASSFPSGRIHRFFLCFSALCRFFSVADSALPPRCGTAVAFFPVFFPPDENF